MRPLIIIFITLFSFFANAQTVPYAGESVWHTKSAFVPGTDIAVDTFPNSSKLTVANVAASQKMTVDYFLKTHSEYKSGSDVLNKIIVKRTIDVIDSISVETRWVITDKVFQFTSAGVKIWKIDSAAIAADGQSATYDITLTRTMDFSEKVVRANTPVGAAKAKPIVVQKATLMIVCAQGLFTEILLIGENTFTTFR